VACVLIVSGNELERELIRAYLSREHQVTTVDRLNGAVKSLKRQKPDVLIAQLSKKSPEAVHLLTHLRDYRLTVPTIVVTDRNCADLKAAARKLGACAFVDRPVSESALQAAVAAAARGTSTASDDVPPLTSEEQRANITQLAKELNGRMKCPAGLRQVFLQSFITSAGTKTTPRVCLRCKVRAEFGMRPHVYYEHIRDICCGDPRRCEAFRLLQKRSPMPMTG